MSELSLLLRVGEHGVLLPYSKEAIDLLADGRAVRLRYHYSGRLDGLADDDSAFALCVIREPDKLFPKEDQG